MITFFKNILKKSQMALFGDTHIEQRERQGGIRQLKSGASVMVKPTTVKMHVKQQGLGEESEKRGSALASPPLIISMARGKEARKPEVGETIYYRTPEMPRKLKGKIVAGNYNNGYEIKPNRTGTVLNPAHIHNIARDHIWTQGEHEAESKPATTRAVSTDESLRRQAVGYERIGITEAEIMRSPAFVKRMKSTLRRLAATNGYNSNFEEYHGVLHNDDQQANELYSEYIRAATGAIRTVGNNATDEQIQEYKDQLNGLVPKSYLSWQINRTGETAAKRLLIKQQQHSDQHTSYDSTGEDDYESGMREIAGQSAEPEYKEDTQEKLSNGIDEQLEMLDDPIAASIIKYKFGLGDESHAWSFNQIASSLNRIDVHNSWTAESVEARMKSALIRLSKTKGVRALLGFLKSMRIQKDEVLLKSISELNIEILCKSHIKEYTRADGTLVQAHEDKRIKKHQDLLFHQNKHGEEIYSGSKLKHGDELIEHLKSRGWKEREAHQIIKNDKPAGKKEDMPEHEEIKAKNRENGALKSSESAMKKMREAALKSDNPVNVLQNITTSRTNPYTKAVDDYKGKLLNHFGYDVKRKDGVGNLEKDGTATRYEKDGHTITLSKEGDEHTVHFAGGDSDKSKDAITSLKGRKEVESIDTGKKNPTFIIGKANKAYTSKMNPVLSHYALVEASEITASHSINGHINRAYPQEIQPRERERMSSQMQMANMMNDIKPELFGAGNRAADGAPILGKDAAVESGNGRTIALTAAYERGLADHYKAYLKEEAESFGLKPEDVEKMNHPVLVRVRDEDDPNTNRAEFAREANDAGNLGSSPAEQAWSDSERIDDNLLDKFTVDEDGEIYNDDNMDFINGFLGKLSKNEASSLRDADGDPNKKAIERVQNAVFTKVYKSSMLTQLQAESAKPKIKNILKALNSCVGDFAQLKGHDDLDVIPDMMEAIEYTLAHQGESKEELEHKLRNAGSLDFTGDTPKFQTDHAIDMILAVANRTNSRSRLESVFKAIGNGIKTEVASRENPEVDIFSGPAQPKTKEQIVKQSLDKLNSSDVNKSFYNFGFTHLLLKSKGATNGRNDSGREIQTQSGTSKKSFAGSRRDGQDQRREEKSRERKESKQGLNRLWLLKSHVRSSSFVNDRGIRINRRDYNDKRTKKQDDRQIRFDFSFRPDASDSDKTDSISLGKRTASMFLRRCGGTLLANAVCEEVTKRGTVSLVGQKINSPRELATLAQVFRNPNYETLRYFFTKGDEIVGQTGVSSRLPHCSNAFPTGMSLESGMDWFNGQAKVCGADGYYLLHNHPSGAVVASDQDIDLTAEMVRSSALKCKGHLIINHNKYNWIDDKLRSHIITDQSINLGEDYNTQPSIPHKLIGRKISSREEFVQLAQELKIKDGYMVVFGQRGMSGISGIMEIPINTSPKKMGVALKQFAKQTSGANMALYIPGKINEGQREMLKQAVHLKKYLSIVLTGNGEDMSVSMNNRFFCGQQVKGHIITAANDRIQKSHVSEYDRITPSGALVHINAHEDSRVKRYAIKLARTENSIQLHKLRQERFGHLPHWGKLDDHTKQQILDAEDEVYEGHKHWEEWTAKHGKNKDKVPQMAERLQGDHSGLLQARLFKGIYLIRKSHVLATNFVNKKGTAIHRSEYENSVLKKYVIPLNRTIKTISEQKTMEGVHFHLFDDVNSRAAHTVSVIWKSPEEVGDEKHVRKEIKRIYPNVKYRIQKSHVSAYDRTTKSDALKQARLFKGRPRITYILKKSAIANHPGYVLRAITMADGTQSHRWIRAGSPMAGASIGGNSHEEMTIAMVAVNAPVFSKTSDSNRGCNRRVAKLRQMAIAGDFDGISNFATSRTRTNYAKVDDYRTELLAAANANRNIPEQTLGQAPDAIRVRGANMDNGALISAQRKINRLHELVMNSDDPVSAILSVETSRTNPYTKAADDYRTLLLRHFGYNTDGHEITDRHQETPPMPIAPVTDPSIAIPPIHIIHNQATITNVNPIPGTANPLNMTADQLGFFPRPDYPLSVRIRYDAYYILENGERHPWPNTYVKELAKKYLDQDGFLQQRAKDYQRGTWLPPIPLTPEQQATADKAKAEAEAEAKARRLAEEEKARLNSRNIQVKLLGSGFAAKKIPGNNITRWDLRIDSGTFTKLKKTMGIGTEQELKYAIGTMLADYGGDITFVVTLQENTDNVARFQFKGSDGTSINRQFELRGNIRSVDHSFFRAGTKGKGSGKAFLRASMGLYKAIGITKVTVHANCDVGGYTWARFGFKPNNWTNCKNFIQRGVDSMAKSDTTATAGGITKIYSKLTTAQHNELKTLLASNNPLNMWAIADMKRNGNDIGKALLLGINWMGTLDMKDEETMLRFANYVNV